MNNLNHSLVYKMNMESKLALTVWGFIGVSALIPALQIISLSLAIVASMCAIIVAYPKVKERIKNIFKFK